MKTSSYARHHINVTMARAKMAGTYPNSILANLEATQHGYDEGHRARELLHLARHLLHQRFGLLPAFLAHHRGDPHELPEIGIVDDMEHGNAPTGLARPPAGIAQRHPQLGRIVDDHEKDAFGRLGRFGRLALLGGGRSGWVLVHGDISQGVDDR